LPMQGHFFEIMVLMAANFAMIKTELVTASSGMVYLPENTGRLIDLQSYTRNPSNVSVTYLLFQYPARGELFNYQTTGTVVQGSQLCCPPTVLSSSRIYFVPEPHDNSEIYGFIGFAVIPTSQMPASISGSLSPPWSTALLQLNVTKANDAPFAGAAGGMLYFDGLDDFAVMRTDSFPTDTFTISVWLKNERTRPLQTVFTLFSPTAGRELELSNTMDLRVLRGADQVSKSTGIFLADGRWHFVAVTWARGYVKLIVDGEVPAMQVMLSFAI
jgi:hypothetical protein